MILLARGTQAVKTATLACSTLARELNVDSSYGGWTGDALASLDRPKLTLSSNLHARYQTLVRAGGDWRWPL